MNQSTYLLLQWGRCSWGWNRRSTWYYNWGVVVWAEVCVVGRWQCQNNVWLLFIWDTFRCVEWVTLWTRTNRDIRESIDGSYLNYLSAKHKWSDSTWSWIDWYSHERHLKVLKGRACLHQLLNFIQDWQLTRWLLLLVILSDVEWVTLWTRTNREGIGLRDESGIRNCDWLR